MVVEVTKLETEEAFTAEKTQNEFGDSAFSLPPRDRFLVSFLVDARGGSMRGSRHPGLRVLVPPSAASAPTRITCRMLRPERTTRPPQLNDSEGLACRIIELGPHPCSFNSPVLLEIPHFAALCGRQRELVVLRSDNGEVWREHSLEATDQAVQSAFGQTFDTLETMEELREKRIIRILTNDFPQYLAVVSRLRQETAMVGSDGGVLSSTVVPQVQAVFPEGALQKRIRVGLQAHPIPTELVSRLLGNRVAVSPIVTLEPRRRKFHKPITLTIPLPKTALRGMHNPASTDSKASGAPSLRLLCSITGGTLPAQWEDITGSTPLSRVKDCVSFTTTVSARFWLMDCQSIHESTDLAGHLYREACLVSYMGKLVVFAKRIDVDEALIRCLCVTDDKVDKTLECQEGFEVCAASPEVELAEGRPVWLEAAGNLLPVAKSGEQLSLQFHAFRENRLAFPVRVRDIQADPVGKFAFMREPRNAATSDSSQSAQRPLCTLEVHVGDDTGGKAVGSNMADAGLLSLSDQLNTSTGAAAQSIPCVFPRQQADLQFSGEVVTPASDRLISLQAEGIIARSQLDLLQVASEVGGDWPRLVGVLLPESGLDATCRVEQLVNWITQNEPQWHEARSGSQAHVGGLGGITVAELRTDRDQALAVLLAWKQHRGDAATGNELNRALRAIGRVDVVKSCMRDIQCVLEEDERAEASKLLNDRDPFEQPQFVPPVPASISLVGTATMLSGMEEIPDDENRSALMAGKPHSIDVDVTQETSVDREFASHEADEPSSIADEERQSTHESNADISGAPISESEELSEQRVIAGTADDGDEEHWQPSSPPVTTTSQMGGDPMLDRAMQDMLSASDDADLVRESESMTASMEEPFDQEREASEGTERQSSTCAPPDTMDHEPAEEKSSVQENVSVDSQSGQQSAPVAGDYDPTAESDKSGQPTDVHDAISPSEMPAEAQVLRHEEASAQFGENLQTTVTESKSEVESTTSDELHHEGMGGPDH